MKDNKENVKRDEHFNQVCVWPGTLVDESKIEDFKKFMMENFDTRIQYLETIETYPDKEHGEIVEGTGGRHDVFFAVHDDDIMKFSIPRLMAGIRWIEDVLDKGNYRCKIYPDRVSGYKN